jgi:hypothetical protein
MQLIFSTLRVIKDEAAGLLRIDIPAALMVALLLAALLPIITRHADNAALLRTFVDDEPVLTMQVDGMTEWPWGDPSTYLDANKHTAHPLPPYWLNIRYDGIVYYGGLYLDIALLAWAPLKAMKFAIFPTVPILFRALSLVFSIFTLLAVYNFGRKHFGLFAGLFGALFLLTEFHFLAIGSIAHPDTLLFFLTLLALPLCIRHANEGSTASLIAIGIVAGLAQGAKMGGPLVAPLAATAIVYSAWGAPGFIGTVFLRGAVVSFAAVATFFLTTPYAAIDPYFMRAWVALTAVFSAESPIEVVNFSIWLSTLVSKASAPLLVAAGLAIGLSIISGRRNLALFFTVLLCAWILVYYALFQRYWVQPQYLIVSYALIAVIGWSLVDRLIALSPIIIPKSAIAAIAVVAVGITAVVKQDRVIGGLITIPYLNYSWRENPAYQVGAWLSKNSQGGDTVLFDTQAYFDPADFPRQFSSGGPIHWTDLARVRPDYFALTVYGRWHWMGRKMAEQHGEPLDPDYYNVRLYQDLLGTDPDHTAALNAAPYITALHKFEPVPRDQQCDSRPLFSLAHVACLVTALLGDGMGPRAPTIWLFKLDPSGLKAP